MIAPGTDLGSALFRAKLAIAKQAERAWHAYIERKIREMLKGSPRRPGSPRAALNQRPYCPN
jgi:hypothetical protein